MSNDWNQISLFRSQINNRRFNDGTLGILESLLVTQNVKSLRGLSSKLREFLRSESLVVIHEIAEKSVEEKLLVLEFFVRAFALAGDNESCLALRYEALVMRDLRSSSNKWLAVSFKEWLTFAEHSLENRFYPIVKKACERALSCFEMTDKSYMGADNYAEDVQVIEKIKRLKDIAVISDTSRSGMILAFITLVGILNFKSSYSLSTPDSNAVLVENSPITSSRILKKEGRRE